MRWLGRRFVLVLLVGIISWAAEVVLIVIGMQHSGIGGGGFMLVRDKDGVYESIGTRSV